ncbi:hypothetical protein BKA69DRAFT_1089361 [Paraphysoderma sedebokerense]|nr:hypothetical protein BKA69DRAFT_1089361 [Paraphysoderma sedebokerense]
MASVVTDLAAPSPYKDRYFSGTNEEWVARLQTSTTLYVGNLSFYTTEEQIYELFSKAGEIKRIIMGLDKNKMTPCGFCFVVYYTHEAAIDCMKYISNTKLDERLIRTDLDPGFKEGRQFGRGRSGGQVRDEYREEYDQGRGGWGPAAAAAAPASSSHYAGQKRRRERQDDDEGPKQPVRQNPRFRERDESDED